jgi:hypothetical protein
MNLNNLTLRWARNTVAHMREQRLDEQMQMDAVASMRGISDKAAAEGKLRGESLYLSQLGAVLRARREIEDRDGYAPVLAYRPGGGR